MNADCLKIQTCAGCNAEDSSDLKNEKGCLYLIVNPGKLGLKLELGACEISVARLCLNLYPISFLLLCFIDVLDHKFNIFQYWNGNFRRVRRHINVTVGMLEIGNQNKNCTSNYLRIMHSLKSASVIMNKYNVEWCMPGKSAMRKKSSHPERFSSPNFFLPSRCQKSAEILSTKYVACS